ncbi:MAG: glycosyltransferase family 39 protein [Deltaproteobacteria bacterium]|nr:glycosyltransferase family 39 protein [Deltaproteobacteria bacterium]
MNSVWTRMVQSLGEQRWKVFFVFFLALLLRLLNLRESGNNPLMYYPVLDEAYYIELGRKIAGGFWLGEDRPFFMDPLYGYFLGAVFRFFGDSLLVVRLLQIALDSLNAVLIYVLGAKTWNRSAGFLAGLVYVSYKVAFFHTLLLLKTTLTVTLPLLFLLLLLHALEKPARTKWFLLGMFNGVMVYLWASFLLMAPLTLLAYWFFKRPRWRNFGPQGVLFIAGVAVLLGAGALRNYTVAGEAALLNTQGGRLLYACNNPGNLTGRYNVPSFSRPHPEHSEADFRKEAERRVGKALSSREASHYWVRETLRFIKDHPLVTGMLLWNKMAGTIGDYEIPTNHSFDLASRFSGVLRWPLPTFAFVLAFGLPGLMIGGLNRREALWLVVPILTVLITVLMFYPSSRFRMPAIPFLTIGCGIGLVTLAGWVRNREFRKSLAFVLAAGLIYGVSLQMPRPAYSDTEAFYLGKAYWSQGRYREAERIAVEGMRRHPDQGRFPLIAGMVALSEDRFEDAVRFNRLALEKNPGDPDAHHNLGLAYLLSGRAGEAVQAIGKALSLSFNGRYLFSLGRAYEETGERAQAVRCFREYLTVSRVDDPYRKDAAERIGMLSRGTGPP